MPIIEYEIYHPYTLEKLELDVCNEEKIQISVPVTINEEDILKHDPNSDYYNDKCYPSTSDDGADIILSDRKNEFINNNLTLCENNCEFSGYNNETKQAICECEIKNEINLSSDLEIDKDKLLSYFSDIKSLINIDVMKCYKLLFTKEGIIKNIGSYILLFTIFVFFASSIIFMLKGFNYFNTQIKNIMRLKEYHINKNKTKNNKNVKNSLNKKKIKKRKRNSFNKGRRGKSKRIKNKKNNRNEPPLKRRKDKLKRYEYSTNSIIKLNTFNKNISTKEKLYKETKSNKNNIQIFNKINTQNVKDDEIMPNYNDYEINSLSYSEALKYDKRSYCQYYFSLLRTKHLFLFSFYLSTDYNSKIIKICLFFFSFSLYYTVNTLFYTDSTLHQIYEESGKFNFIYHIPQILYSTIISSIINMIVKTLSLSEKNILEIKQEKQIKNCQSKIKKILVCLRIKFICFYIFSFIFLITFWYYLACFCAVYKNTQIHLIKDTFLSFCLSLLYPFGLNLLPGMFRIPAINGGNNNKICLYRISKIIQLI